MTRHVVLDRRQPRRRIERHRHAAREQGAVEGEEVVAAGRQHDRDALAGEQALRGEPGRTAHRTVPDEPVGQRIFGAVLVEMDREPIGLALDVVRERFGERAHVQGRPHAIALGEAGDVRVGTALSLRRAGEDEAQQVARRLARRQRVLGQGNRELLLEPQHELDPREAVEAEVGVEGRIESDLRRAAGAKLSHDGADGLDQSRRRRPARRWRHRARAQKRTGSEVSPRSVDDWRHSGVSRASASLGMRRSSASIAICASTRASGAPRQKWMPKPNARCWRGRARSSRPSGCGEW